jgi:hypothetical protein
LDNTGNGRDVTKGGSMFHECGPLLYNGSTSALGGAAGCETYPSCLERRETQIPMWHCQLSRSGSPRPFSRPENRLHEAQKQSSNRFLPSSIKETSQPLKPITQDHLQHLKVQPFFLYNREDADLDGPLLPRCRSSCRFGSNTALSMHGVSGSHHNCRGLPHCNVSRRVAQHLPC